MLFSSEGASHILSHAANVMAKDEPADQKLQRLWHNLLVFRASVLASLLFNTVGSRVLSGPFKGMQLLPEITTQIFGPVLTGQYEHELHGIFERVIAYPYKRILNIGSGFGYYSTGLALRMPQVVIDAFDIDETEQKKCRDMATLNNVQDRVRVQGIFRGDDFASYADGSTLVLVDIEGAEKELLDPENFPALKRLDMIVELHDVFGESISDLLLKRFASTHTIEIVYNKPGLFDFEPVMGQKYYMDPIDSVIITWENRAGPTPWAFMRVR